jgi:hypothetical protein
MFVLARFRLPEEINDVKLVSGAKPGGHLLRCKNQNQIKNDLNCCLVYFCLKFIGHVGSKC